MPSSKAPSAQLSRALLHGNFALAEKKWAAGARWGEPNEPNAKGVRRNHRPGEQLPNGNVWFEHHALWFNVVSTRPDTAIWDFLDSHDAPLFGHPPTNATRTKLLNLALYRGRLDLADWLLDRGLPLDEALSMPSVWVPQAGTAHATRAQTWHWALDHYRGMGPVLKSDEHPPSAVKLFYEALELALEDEEFLPVIDRLLGLGAKVTVVRPTQTQDPGVAIPGALESVRIAGGTALHALVLMATQAPLVKLDWSVRLKLFPALWDRLVAAGADPATPGPDGQTALDLLAGSGILQDHLRNIRAASEREARALGEPLAVSRQARPRRRS